MEICDACGSQDAAHTVGTSKLCATCKIIVAIKAIDLREENKPVNPLFIAKKVLRENYSNGSYIIRDIPTALWVKVKNKAAKDKDTIRNVILKALYQYLG